MEPIARRTVRPAGRRLETRFGQRRGLKAVAGGAILVLAIAVALPGTGHSHSPGQPSADQRAKSRDLSIQACLAMPDSYEKTICLEPHFRALTREVSARHALGVAKEMSKQGKLDDCHLIAHFIGDETIHKHQFDTGKALASCSLDCIQGCIHGAMQTYVSEKIDSADLTAELQHVCDSVTDDALLRRQCVHGVGHGFLSDGYLTLSEAIDACHHFQGREALTCLGGVSMQIVQPYLMISEPELKARLPDICEEAIAAGKDRFDKRCPISIGAGLMFFTGHDLKKSTRLCGLLPANQRPACVVGAVGEAEDAALSGQ